MLLEFCPLCKSSRVCNPRFVVITGSWIVGDGPQGLIYIYAPTDFSERHVFFDLHIYFVSNWDYSDSIFFGDFNSVLQGQEWSGVNGFGLAFMDLCNFVDASMISRFRVLLSHSLGTVRTLTSVGLIGSSSLMGQDLDFLMSNR